MGICRDRNLRSTIVARRRAVALEFGLIGAIFCHLPLNRVMANLRKSLTFRPSARLAYFARPQFQHPAGIDLAVDVEDKLVDDTDVARHHYCWQRQSHFGD